MVVTQIQRIMTNIVEGFEREDEEGKVGLTSYQTWIANR